MERLLFVAAQPREFAGLLRFCGSIERLNWPVRWARAGELRGRRIVMVANGAGAKQAAHGVDATVKRCPLKAIISTGFCGALAPTLRIGDIFVATAIQGAPVPLRLPQSSRPYAAGVLASVDHIAQTAAEKQILCSHGAGAVEMEAAGVAERAQTHQLPLFCVRSVTDLWDETLHNDLNSALREDGQFATMQILRSALVRPATRVPELMRLYYRCRIAARSLGEFFAGCRF